MTCYLPCFNLCIHAGCKFADSELKFCLVTTTDVAKISYQIMVEASRVVFRSGLVLAPYPCGGCSPNLRQWGVTPRETSQLKHGQHMAFRAHGSTYYHILSIWLSLR